MIIKKLLDGKWASPDTGLHIEIPIKNIIIGEGLAESSDRLISQLNSGTSPLIVCDKNTYNAMGKNIESKTGAPVLILPENTKPDSSNVDRIIEESSSHDLLVTVGSGTINDLCKYASSQIAKPYIVFGTAPSMNGYASANASIIAGSKKKSLKAGLPDAIFLDLDVLEKAPIRLIQSGLGDSICRPTAQADWLLSHLVLGTRYMKAPFELLKDEEPALFANSAALINGDKKAMEILARILILSGIGMYISDGSYPASQGEHMIAHYMEEKQTNSGSYHGEQIAVTTLHMARLQEKILSGNELRITGKIREKQIRAENITKLEKNWSEIRDKIKKVTVAHDELKKVLLAAKAPTKYSDIGWDKKLYEESLKNALFTRDRFTFLDIEFLTD